MFSPEKRSPTMQTEHLAVTGMTCGGCVDSVTDALRAIGGVKDVNVSLASASATIQFDERLTSADELALAVRQAGYEAGDVAADRTSKRKGCCCG
jgi:copper chaperone